jgi:hypothetical protein
LPLNEGSKTKEEKEREEERQLYIQFGVIFTLVITGKLYAIVWDITGVSSTL